MKKTTIFICTAVLSTMLSPVFANHFRLAKLPDKGENFGCLTCHVSEHGGPVNSFGSDYKAFAIEAGDLYTKFLGQLDSDDDRFTNDQEFAAGTHPGDGNSRPKEVRPTK
jgi:hypothetical protein